MKYSTPELFLVGAAQNLVLGDSPELRPGCETVDPPKFPEEYIDTSSW